MAVHRHLREGFRDGDFERRVFEPRDRHFVRERRIGRVFQKHFEIGVLFFRPGFQPRRGAEIFLLFPRGRFFGNNATKGMLNKVNVVQVFLDRQVVEPAGKFFQQLTCEQRSRS